MHFRGDVDEKKKGNNYNIASNRANNCKCKRSNKRVFKQRDVNRKITVGTGILSYIFSVYICLSGSKKLHMPSVVFQVFCSTNHVQVIVQLVISPPFFFGAGVVQIKHIRYGVCIVTSI